MEMAQALQAARDPPDHGRRADARRRLPPHAPVRDARGLHEPLPPASPPRTGPPAAGRARAAPRAAAARTRSTASRASRSRRSSGTPRGSSACRAARASGAVASRVEAGRHAGGGGRGAPAARHLRARPLPDRAPAPVLAPRQAPQPAARRAGRAARGARGRHRQRPRARARADRAPGRDGRGGARQDARRDASRQRRGNSSHVLAPPERMAERFREHPDAVEESGRLAERLALRPHRGPRLPLPRLRGPGRRLEAGRALRATASTSATARPRLARPPARLDEELRVIRHLGLSGFFLLHRDMLELAREVAAEVRGPESSRRLLPPGRGRGSSVSSIVCYLTGLSHVDPIANELLLGRFLNEELTALPDIDLDFPRDIREVLIPRVHDRYGRDRCALVAAFSTFQVRSAVRDFAKALGLPPGEIERLARAGGPVEGPERHRGRGARAAASPRWDALVKLARDAWGLPRHMSQHPGGMVISTQPLIDLCPVQPASMEGRQMVQWDKDSCGDAGFLKIDLLGLGMLSAVERCVDEIARVRGRADRPVADPLRRRGGLRADPGGGDDGRVPDRVARADADAEAHAAGDARRPDRPGGARAARADHRRGGAPVHRAAQGAARGPGLPGARTSTRRSSRCCATRSARSSSRTRCSRWRWRSPASAPGEAEGLRRAMSRQALGGGDPRVRGEVHRGRDGARAPRARWPSGSGRRSSASPASASRRRTRRRSGCSPTSRPGCGCTTTRSSSARC